MTLCRNGVGGRTAWRAPFALAFLRPIPPHQRPGDQQWPPPLRLVGEEIGRRAYSAPTLVAESSRPSN